MAKYERTFKGNFNSFLSWLDNDITTGSVSATYEDGSSTRIGNVELAVRVYERYSMLGGNRVSLNVTLLGKEEELFLSAITSGGSQAVFLKINTFGESAFLDVCKNSVENYISRY